MNVERRTPRCSSSVRHAAAILDLPSLLRFRSANSTAISGGRVRFSLSLGFRPRFTGAKCSGSCSPAVSVRNCYSRQPGCECSRLPHTTSEGAHCATAVLGGPQSLVERVLVQEDSLLDAQLPSRDPRPIARRPLLVPSAPMPNPSIERTCQGPLRAPCPAAHVERWAPWARSLRTMRLRRTVLPCSPSLKRSCSSVSGHCIGRRSSAVSSRRSSPSILLQATSCLAQAASAVRWSRAGAGKSGGVRVIYFTRTAEGEVVLAHAVCQGQDRQPQRCNAQGVPPCPRRVNL